MIRVHMERNCHSAYLHKYIYTVESIHKKSVKVVFKTCCSYSLDMNQFKLINRKYTRKAPGRISSSIKLQTVGFGPALYSKVDSVGRCF